MRRDSPFFRLLFFGLALGAAAPLWLVEHPPIQDLPQHLAAIRVLTDHDDPTLRFGEYFDVELGRTQYLAYYLAARLLAPVLGVALANLLLLSLAIVATPYAMRSLLRALGRDDALALFVLPLTWNAHLMLGFLNFVAAIPLMLFGLALAVRYREVASPGRAVGLAAVTLLTFYTHVVPFGFLALGAALVGLGDDLRGTVRGWLPLVPAGAATLVWAMTSPAGEATLTAANLAGAGDAARRPVFVAWGEAVRAAPGWLTDVMPGQADDRVMVGWALAALLCLAVGARTDEERGPLERDYLVASLHRRVGVLAPLALLAYFVTPISYDWIWPISARFPLLALLFLVPILPEPKRLGAFLVYALVVSLSVTSFVAVGRAFRAFERDEVGALDAAIASIPPGSRVAGLIFARGSRYVRFAPFLHSVAWYQAARGGAVMFTFDDFPQSPIRFREDTRPPRVPPRWEWTPERVDPGRDLDWYQYVLTRGGPGRIGQTPGTWELIFDAPPWRVYRRSGEVAP